MDQGVALGTSIYNQRLKENDYNFYLPVAYSIIRTELAGKSLQDVVISIHEQADIRSKDLDNWERTYFYLNQHLLPYQELSVSLERSEGPVGPYPEAIRLVNEISLDVDDNSTTSPTVCTDDSPKLSPSHSLFELAWPPWSIPADLLARPTTKHRPDQWFQPYVRAPSIQPLLSTCGSSPGPQIPSISGSERTRQTTIRTSNPDGQAEQPSPTLQQGLVQQAHPTTPESISEQAQAAAKTKKQKKERRNRMPKPASMDDPFAEPQTPDALRKKMFPASAPYISGPGKGRNNFRKTAKPVIPWVQPHQSLGPTYPQVPTLAPTFNFAMNKDPRPESQSRAGVSLGCASNPIIILGEQEHQRVSFRPYLKMSEICSDQSANNKSPLSVVPGSLPPTLPPSVEEAYKKKCIELKRRLQEVEESNDTFRLRKVRLMRGIRKMRLERAFLLETLGKRMKKNGSGINGMQGIYDEDSEGSSEGPPTPHEKPLRSKRSHRRPMPSPPPHLNHQNSIPNAHHHLHPAQGFQTAFQSNQEASFSAIPTTNGTSTTYIQPRPNTSFVHADSQSPQVARSYRPLVPFDDFVETAFLSRPQEFPDCHSQDDLVALATRHWQAMNESEREPWNARYEQRQAEYQETRVGLVRRGSRERVRNMDVGETRDVEMEERGGSGSGAGFTAVNG